MKKTLTGYYEAIKGVGLELEIVLLKASGQRFYNISRYTLGNLGEGQTRANLKDYIGKFNGNTREVFANFNFDAWLDRLASANPLCLVMRKFAAIDLHLQIISSFSLC